MAQPHFLPPEAEERCKLPRNSGKLLYLPTGRGSGTQQASSKPPPTWRRTASGRITWPRFRSKERCSMLPWMNYCNCSRGGPQARHKFHPTWRRPPSSRITLPRFCSTERFGMPPWMGCRPSGIASEAPGGGATSPAVSRAATTASTPSTSSHPGVHIPACHKTSSMPSTSSHPGVHMPGCHTPLHLCLVMHSKGGVSCRPGIEPDVLSRCHCRTRISTANASQRVADTRLCACHI